MKVLVFLTACVGLCAAQVPGLCSTTLERQAFPDFNPARYTGIWYEMQRVENIFQKDGECTILFYRANSDGSVFVRNAQVQPGGAVYEEEGEAVVAFPNENPVLAILNVTFPEQPPIHPNYYILDTDYDNYSLVWNCWQISAQFKLESVWFMQRSDARISRPDSVQRIIDAHFRDYEFRTTFQSPACVNRAGINRTVGIDEMKL